MQILPAQPSDSAAIWAILQPIIRAGETYALPRDMAEAEAIAYWLGGDRETFVAEDDGRILGTYYLQAQPTRRRLARRLPAVTPPRPKPRGAALAARRPSTRWNE